MLEKYALKTTDKVFIQQSANNKGVGTLNDDGHLYFFDEEQQVAYRLPDEYKDTPIILYHPCGGYQEGLIMVSLLGEVPLQYHHDFFDVAGIWGWIDLEGNVVIEPQYIYAMSFDSGKAIVCKGEWSVNENGEYWSDDEAWGVIDKKGKAVIPLEFNEITAVEDSEDLFLCHYGNWQDDCHYCVYNASTGEKVFELGFNFDNCYMFNHCYFNDGKIIFEEHIPENSTNFLYVYDLMKKDWEYYHEQYEVTLNGEDRVVVNKDGYEIVIF